VKLVKPITYWPPKKDGEVFYTSPPQVIQGAWVIDDNGEVLVDTVVEPGGYLMQGVSDIWDPRDVPAAFRIMSYGERPCLRSLQQLKIAVLA